MEEVQIHGGSTKPGMTNAEKKAKADEIRKDVAKFCGDDLSKKSTEGIRNYINKILQYKNTYNGDMDQTMMQYYALLNNELDARNEKKDTTIFENQVNLDGEVVTPGEDKYIHKNALLGESSASSSHTIDEVINEAQGFIQKGDSEKIDTSELKKASDTLYNILLAIGVIATVIVGLYLAIKYMVSSIEEQAKIKESIIPYIVGCVVIYGAFIIWKLAILLLRGIS